MLDLSRQGLRLDRAMVTHRMGSLGSHQNLGEIDEVVDGSLSESLEPSFGGFTVNVER